MNNAGQIILENIIEYAAAFVKAYAALIASGLPPDVAQNEARALAFLTVSPANAPPNAVGFGPTGGRA